MIKIKFLDFKKERKELSKKIEEQSKAHLAGLIGHVAIFYKQQKDKEKRKIKKATFNLPDDTTSEAQPLGHQDPDVLTTKTLVL